MAQLAARLRALGPQGTLDRGYALVLDAKGHPLSRVKKALEGQSVRIVLSKGVIGASLGDALPEKTLIDALEPQTKDAAAGPAKKPRKKSPRK